MGGQSKYDTLMGKLDEIAEQVSKFPDCVKPLVFNALVDSLVNEKQENKSQSSTCKSEVVKEDNKSDLQDSISYEEEVKEWYRRNMLYGLNDMEFSAFAAYWYSERAPEGKRVDVIGEEHIRELCEIVSRKAPAKAVSSLYNATNLKSYLVKRGKGVFGLTVKGRSFVERMLKGNE